MQRKHIPDTRPSMTHKRSACGIEFYTTVSFHEEVNAIRPAEVFVRLGKMGDITGGLVDALCTTTSIALQWGVPWESLKKHWRGHKFGLEDGRVDQEGRPLYTSIVDGIAQAIDHLIEERKRIVGLDEDKPDPRRDSGGGSAGVPAMPKPPSPKPLEAAVAPTT